MAKYTKKAQPAAPAAPAGPLQIRPAELLEWIEMVVKSPQDTLAEARARVLAHATRPDGGGEMLLTTIVNYTTDIAENEAVLQVWAKVAEWLEDRDHGATFRERLVTVARYATTEAVRIAAGRPWEFGSCDPVRNGVEMVRLRGRAKTWAAVHDHLGYYADGLTSGKMVLVEPEPQADPAAPEPQADAETQADPAA